MDYFDWKIISDKAWDTIGKNLYLFKIYYYLQLFTKIEF